MPSLNPGVAPFIINTNTNKSNTNGNNNSNVSANGNGNGNLNGNGNGNGNANANASNNANTNGTRNGSNSPSGTSTSTNSNANANTSPSNSSNNSHRGSGHNSPVNRPIRSDRMNCAPTASNAQGLFPPAACVFIGKVPLEQQGKELEEKFSSIGPCYVKTNVDRKKELPSAFVQFEKIEHAETALTWHNTMQLHDRLLRVEVSKAIRAGIMGHRNGEPITLDNVKDALRGRGTLDYCTLERTTSGTVVSKVVFSFVGDYQDAIRHFQNDHFIYLKPDYGIRPISSYPPPLPRYSQPQHPFYPPTPALFPQTSYPQRSGAYHQGSYSQAPPPPFPTFPPFLNYPSWTYPQEDYHPQSYAQSPYRQRTYHPYAQGTWCPPQYWSEPPYQPEPDYYAVEEPQTNMHIQALNPGIFFPPEPWSEAHYAASAPPAPGSQSAQTQTATSQSTGNANGNEMTPPSSPGNKERKTEEQAGDEIVAEEATKEKKENKEGPGN